MYFEDQNAIYKITSARKTDYINEEAIKVEAANPRLARFICDEIIGEAKEPEVFIPGSSDNVEYEIWNEKEPDNLVWVVRTQSGNSEIVQCQIKTFLEQ